MRQLDAHLTIFALLCFFGVMFVQGFPDTRNPNLEYELISGGSQSGPKPTPQPAFVPITRKPLIINTPPTTDPNSKSFAYDSQTKTWTVVKKSDPSPAEGTLIWNQGNDKWLTNTPNAKFP